VSIPDAARLPAPLVIERGEELAWDDRADIVVVGFGGAGVATAIEARDGGAEVIALDRFAGGGATRFSGGVVYAGGTSYQREAGFADSADNMFAYLSQEASPVSPATLRRFCDGSAADLDWLAANGVPFAATAFEDKTAYPPEGYFLYYSGNEKIPSYARKAAPAPRGHRVVGTGYTGRNLFDPLRGSALAKGVRLQSHSPVRRLIVDRAGTVLGVEAAIIPEARQAEHDAIYRKLNPMRPFAGPRHERAIAEAAAFEQQFTQTRLIRATRGVVLATGGFIYNLDMIRDHRPLYARIFKALVRIGSMGCDGSGIRLGQSVGGATGLMDEIFTSRAIVPPTGFAHGLLVDGEGRRLINEDAYTGFVGEAIGRQGNGGRAWLILDRDSYGEALRECLWPRKGLAMYTLPSLLNIMIGGSRKARDLASLARKCGIDSALLEKTVADNNVAAAGGAADRMGKAPENIRPVGKPPFRAINMDLGNRFASTLVFTLGGLLVDEESGAVKREDGSPIPGLYAAGRVGVGLCSKGYLSGLSIADTVFSGRRAARALIGETALPGQ
jgi:3-oxo-5alpha-steroid 4-dehydrogenase